MPVRDETMGLPALAVEKARTLFAALATAGGEPNWLAAFTLGVVAATDDPNWAAQVRVDFLVKMDNALAARGGVADERE